MSSFIFIIIIIIIIIIPLCDVTTVARDAIFPLGSLILFDAGTKFPFHRNVTNFGVGESISFPVNINSSSSSVLHVSLLYRFTFRSYPSPEVSSLYHQQLAWELLEGFILDDLKLSQRMFVNSSIFRDT
jgi:hypothetical protein